MQPKTLWLSFNRYKPNREKGERDLNTYSAAYEKLEYATRADAALSTQDFITLGVGVDDPGEWTREDLLARMEGAIAYEFAPDDPQEKGVRKDRKGWVEYFKFALPRDITEEQQREYVHSWARALGKGRAVFIGAIHRDTEGNPHAHVLVLDRLETEYMATKRMALRGEGGKRTRARREFVCRFSERGTMQRMRDVYRDAANAYLEQVNAPVRIETLSYEKLGINKKPQVHEGSARKMQARGKKIETRDGELTRPNYNRKVAELNDEIASYKAKSADAARTVAIAVEDARQANLQAKAEVARAAIADRVAGEAVAARQRAEEEAITATHRAEAAARAEREAEERAGFDRRAAVLATQAKEEAERQARDARRKAEEAERRRRDEEEAKKEVARQLQDWLRIVREIEERERDAQARRDAERKREADRLQRLIDEKQEIETAKGNADRALAAMTQRLVEEKEGRAKDQRAAETIIARTVHVALMAIALVEVYWRDLAAKLKALLPIKTEKPSNGGTVGGYVLPADFGQRIGSAHQDAERARGEAILARSKKSTNPGAPGQPELVKLYQMTPGGKPLTLGGLRDYVEQEFIAATGAPPASVKYEPYFPNPQKELERMQRERAQERGGCSR